MRSSVPKRVKMAVLASSARKSGPRFGLKAVDVPRAEQGLTSQGIFSGWSDPRGYTDAELEEMANDAVDAWHADPASPVITLHAFLGLTWAEYARWIEHGSLASVLSNRDRLAQSPQ